MEKTFKREDGTKIKLFVSVYKSSIPSEPPMKSIEVSRCEKGKRTYYNVHETDYTYRSLSFPEREAHKLSAQLQHVTRYEINSLLRECVEEIYNACKLTE